MRNIFNKSSITIELCNKMIEKAFGKAKEFKMNISLTIVDESGLTKAFSRMDNAPIASIDTSRKKAITAIGMGAPSGETWYNYIKGDPILLHGIQNVTDFILLGGGSPIVIDKSIIGAIGISGGHYKQDEECVKAALEVI